MWGNWAYRIIIKSFSEMDRIYSPSHLETHRNPIFICKILCMADMVAHYYGTHAAQILIILPKPLTNIPEWGKVD